MVDQIEQTSRVILPDDLQPQNLISKAERNNQDTIIQLYDVQISSQLVNKGYHRALGLYYSAIKEATFKIHGPGEMVTSADRERTSAVERFPDNKKEVYVYDEGRDEVELKSEVVDEADYVDIDSITGDYLMKKGIVRYDRLEGRYYRTDKDRRYDIVFRKAEEVKSEIIDLAKQDIDEKVEHYIRRASKASLQERSGLNRELEQNLSQIKIDNDDINEILDETIERADRIYEANRIARERGLTGFLEHLERPSDISDEVLGATEIQIRFIEDLTDQYIIPFLIDRRQAELDELYEAENAEYEEELNTYNEADEAEQMEEPTEPKTQTAELTEDEKNLYNTNILTIIQNNDEIRQVIDALEEWEGDEDDRPEIANIQEFAEWMNQEFDYPIDTDPFVQEQIYFFVDYVSRQFQHYQESLDREEEDQLIKEDPVDRLEGWIREQEQEAERKRLEEQRLEQERQQRIADRAAEEQGFKPSEVVSRIFDRLRQIASDEDEDGNEDSDKDVA